MAEAWLALGRSISIFQTRGCAIEAVSITPPADSGEGGFEFVVTSKNQLPPFFD
jgi:hypothetical protein